ncbi:3-oxoacyl-[acyl-carrier-protein] synthase-3 [Ruminiclostridium sufflavum DSM 19573]|uniref:3-oxoacyl-[acyl-carrier-protein] synthase-3 n=1 Tax=Ruminiclostridium sufflavum DSM 19573 TaxID=1121337 RepID=A0A318XJ87_9FIRM|nr:3-oxoacyl-[acyl-carrier-protein] synthase III C-terminal domain-containing protein [Ruminiclostridium sufflavum]PYG85778.1 3-oxoacyl-[acyl-carrier-protein] synthase-3 [Ruminiclostridium sufflavum DSM 19573]
MRQNNFVFPTNKKKYFRKFSKVISVAAYLPEKAVTNEDIIRDNKLAVKDSVIRKSIGVYKRRIAEADAVDSDILAHAAQSCIDKAGINADALSRIIATKFFGDNLLPMTASMIQRKIGSTYATQSFDIDGGINSFLQALDLGTRYINSGDDYVLISSGGVCNRLISKTDPRVAFLFGDGAASVLLAPSEEPHFLAGYFFTNYNYYEIATTQKLKPEFTKESFEKGDFSLFYDYYRMDNWKLAEDFYRTAAITVRDCLLEESNLKMSDIDLVLATENNKAIWEVTLDALGVSQEKSISLIHEYGNTMSAMLPLLLDEAYSTGRIESGMNILMLSHGEGFSGGGMIYRA